MRFILSFLIAVSLFNRSFGQNKTELPPGFFDPFSYTLSPSFNSNNEASLKNEVDKIAAEMTRWLDSAELKHIISNKDLLYYLTDERAVINYQAKKFKPAINNIQQCRISKPTPVYAAPYRLFNLAYAEACLIHPDDASDAFKDIFKQQLLQQFNSIDSVFKNDIVSQQKGNFNTASVDNFTKTLARAFDQVKNNSGGKVDFDAAYTIINTYQLYYLRKAFQPLIEEVLFAISPARVKETKVKIPMRDGIKLNAFIYKDESGNGTLPAIVSLSPYPSGFEANRGNVFAVNGYIYVYVDTRGRRESEGNFMPYEDDASDYYDIIDWVSKQPWCNGKVVTSGGSYLGFAQWQAIRKKYKHPALKAINPMVSVGFGIDFPRANNEFYSYILQWATYVSGKELNNALFYDNKFWNSKNYELYKKRLPFEKLDSVAGMPNPIFQKWVAHPDFDDYWKSILPAKEDYEAIDIPVFSITGYYDDDQNGALYYYNNHLSYGNAKAKDQHYLLIGPYEHGAAQWQPGPIQMNTDLEKQAQIPIYKYVIQWFDWVLKGKNKPAFIKDKVTYFETGNNQWKGTGSFKDLTTDSLELYLTPQNIPNKRRKDLMSLSLQQTASSPVHYKHDIALAIDSAFLFSTSLPDDDSLYMSSPYNIVFESKPVGKDIVLSDRITARIYMKLNVPDADFDIAIYEITPDGKSINIAYDAKRIRYRNGGDKPQLAKPGEVVLLNFDEAYIYIKKISKGSKLRFEFQSTNKHWQEKNYGFGGIVSKESTDKPRWIEADILMDSKYASKIVVPYTTK